MDAYSVMREVQLTFDEMYGGRDLGADAGRAWLHAEQVTRRRVPAQAWKEYRDWVTSGKRSARRREANGNAGGGLRPGRRRRNFPRQERS